MATRPELGVIVLGGTTLTLAAWHLAKFSSAFCVSDTVAECILITWRFAHVAKLPRHQTIALAEIIPRRSGRRPRGNDAGGARERRVVVVCHDMFTWLVATTPLHGGRRDSYRDGNASGGLRRGEGGERRPHLRDGEAMQRVLTQRVIVVGGRAARHQRDAALDLRAKGVARVWSGLVFGLSEPLGVRTGLVVLRSVLWPSPGSPPWCGRASGSPYHWCTPASTGGSAAGAWSFAPPCPRTRA